MSGFLCNIEYVRFNMAGENDYLKKGMFPAD